VGAVAFLLMPRPDIKYVKSKKSQITKDAEIYLEELKKYNEHSIDSLIIKLEKAK
jgi:hypothetical protein